MVSERRILIGTAGWAIPAGHDAFPKDGTTLQRYATVFGAVEINSSFHRRHRPDTWRRWAEVTPDHFRFAVKLPKTITHQAKLVDSDLLVSDFADDVAGLGGKLAVVLVQLPPSLAYDAPIAAAFFTALAGRVDARIACEPRHPTWFDPAADEALVRLGVSRVAADPAIVDAAAHPGGADSLRYWRLHGSPQMYRSEYGDERLREYARSITAERAEGDCWCMFDNTASSAAIVDALNLARIAV